MASLKRLVAGVALLVPGLSRAEPVALPLLNPSFEEFVLGAGAYRVGDIGGWQRDGSGKTTVGIQAVSSAVFTLAAAESPLPAPADGMQFAFMNPPAEGETVALFQVIGALRPRTRYTFTVAIGNRRDKGYADKLLLELRNGDTPASPVLASASNADTPPDGGFADHSVSFATGQYVTGNLLIAIRNQGGSQIAFDNVRVTIEPAQAAAEPARAP